MQKYFFLFSFLTFALVFHSCKRIDDNGVDIEYEASGDILGIDLTQCACCGGYLVKVDNVDTVYNVSELPAGNDLDIENATYPVPIRFDWTSNVSPACPRIITIEAIIKD